MVGIKDLVNCEQFFSFYERNKDKTISLLINTEEDLEMYNKGLDQLELFLEENGISETENQYFFGRYQMEKEDRRLVYVCLYKCFNCHISTGMTSAEIDCFKRFKTRYDLFTANEIIKRCGEIGDVVSDLRVCLLLIKILRVPFQISINNSYISFPTSGIESSEFDNASSNTSHIYDPKNQQAKRLRTSNLYFATFGHFFPDCDFEDSQSSFDCTTSLLDFKIDQIPRSFSRYLVHVSQSNSKNERDIENEMTSFIALTAELFSETGISISTGNQSWKSWSFTNTAIAEELKVTGAYLDISVNVTLNDNGESKHFVVPVEIKRGKLQQFYQEFINAWDINNIHSSNFIKLFSQAFQQSLVCGSLLFFLTDGNFCIAVLLDAAIPEVDDNAYIFRGVKCQLKTFDSSQFNVNVSLFIVITILTYKDRLAIDKAILNAYIKKFSIGAKEKSNIIQLQYQMLDKFWEKLSNIEVFQTSLLNTNDLITTAPFDNDKQKDTNDSVDGNKVDNFIDNGIITLPPLSDVEGEIVQQFGCEIHLQKFVKIAELFKEISISLIKPKSIIEGANINRSYSTILEDKDGNVIKIYDPIRSRSPMRRGTTHISFGQKLKFAFDSFIREATTILYLEDRKFDKKPKLLEIGFVKIDVDHGEVQWLDELKPDNLVLSGFYIRMTFVPGLTLDRIVWTVEIAELLKKLLNDLNELRVSHGDIHGGNVLFDESTGVMTFIDFGVSSQADFRGLNQVQKKLSEDRFERRVQKDRANVDSLVAYFLKR